MMLPLLEVTVHIDRGLGLQVALSLQRGATVAEVKERLSQDDPTGQVRPVDLALSAVGRHGALPDGLAITEELLELELCPAAVAEEIAIQAPATAGAIRKAAEASPLDGGGPLVYSSAVAGLFMKRSEDPTSGKIAKVKVPAGVSVYATGRVWTGPSGGRWAELDAARGAERGWALVEGPGFGLSGPALVDSALVDELPPGQEYARDFLGLKRGRCRCGRCGYYRPPDVAVGG